MEPISDLRNITVIVSKIQKTIADRSKEVLTPEGAADFLSISVDSLNFYTTSKNPVIPYTGFGKHKRFLKSELIKWLREKQTRTPMQLLNHLKEMDKNNGKSRIK